MPTGVNPMAISDGRVLEWVYWGAVWRWAEIVAWVWWTVDVHNNRDIFGASESSTPLHPVCSCRLIPHLDVRGCCLDGTVGATEKAGRGRGGCLLQGKVGGIMHHGMSWLADAIQHWGIWQNYLDAVALLHSLSSDVPSAIFIVLCWAALVVSFPSSLCVHSL